MVARAQLFTPEGAQASGKPSGDGRAVVVVIFIPIACADIHFRGLL
ncbi:hypothetical protein [Reyranella soli]|nr:hypothetical protein [Reyranella soli]